MDNFKWSALHFACHAGQKDIIEFLLNNGALLDVQSSNGGTPIMRAIESSKPGVVQFLIDKGFAYFIFLFFLSYFSNYSSASGLFELIFKDSFDTMILARNFQIFFDFTIKLVFCVT